MIYLNGAAIEMKNDIFDFWPNVIVPYFIYEPSVIKEGLATVSHVSKREKKFSLSTTIYSLTSRKNNKERMRNNGIIFC